MKGIYHLARVFVCAFACTYGTSAKAQVLLTHPVIPFENDTISLFFDASQGNGELAGVDTVYAHAGLITNYSQFWNDWQHVQGVWGTDDPKVRMVPLGNDRHRLDLHIPSFFNVLSGTVVQELAFVFRNKDGNLVGRTLSGADFKYPVAQVGSGLKGLILNDPLEFEGAVVGDSLRFVLGANFNGNIRLYINNMLVDSVLGEDLLRYDGIADQGGMLEVKAVFNWGGQEVRDSLSFLVRKPLQEVPIGMKPGVNKLNDSTVTLVLYAPFKEYVHVLNSESAYQKNHDNLMIQTPDSSTFWVTLHTGTDSVFTFQYLIDGELRIGDPYSELVLDPVHDVYLDPALRAEFPAYPQNLTADILTVHYNVEPAYSWKNSSFEKPAPEELVIYELLLRDFLEDHNYSTLLDTLSYIRNLGVNAIEFMPFSEFEGNSSWGYNPSYQMALDKYYGTKNQLKEFIDSCHSLGIAVIMDQVFNHVYSQSPIARMWWDDSLFQPSAQNPYLNETCPHVSTCWGFDMDHFAQPTKDYVDQINRYWIEEFHIDGVRFDFTKGFTNSTFSNQVDLSRVGILQRIADTLWAQDPDFYVILEHWASNAEEKILSDYGTLLWGNVSHQFQEAAMGYHSNSDLTWALSDARGWNDRHLITYMESHDEERIPFKIKEYGNLSNPSYNVRGDSIALERMIAASALFYSTPGPKLLYMFSELGFDESINDPCRVCEKNIHWNYLQDPDRMRLYYYTASLIDLRQRYGLWNTDSLNYSLSSSVKQLSSQSADSNFAVVVNFGVVEDSVPVQFAHTGWWYDYFGRDSLLVGQNQMMHLRPGEWGVYTDVKLATPKYYNKLFPAAPLACIQCDSLAVGSFFTVGGDSIEVVDRARLLDIIEAEGDLTKVCVSHVTDMKNVFRGAKWFNQDISAWDVSNVTNMRGMFFNAETFNQNISRWDVGTVTDMSQMFFRADSFNQPIGVWDVSQVELFSRMFKEAGSFRADLSAWDVSSAVRMGEMFRDADSFDGDLSRWCVSQFEYYNVPSQFGTGSLMGAEDLPRWGNCPNTYDRVETLASGAFLNDRGCVDCSALNVGDYFELGGDTLLVVDRAMLDSLVLIRADLSKVCVSLVTDLSDLLRGETWFNTDLSAWDVSNVTTMNNMLRKTKFFNQEIGNWDVSSVANFSRMFLLAENFNGDISGWDVSGATRMNTMFKGAQAFNQNLQEWDVSGVFNMDNMFRRASAFSQDLSSWCVPLITSKPVGFDANSGLNSGLLPNWGCVASSLVSPDGKMARAERTREAEEIQAGDVRAGEDQAHVARAGEVWDREVTLFPNPTNGMVEIRPVPEGFYELINEHGQILERGAIQAAYELTSRTKGIYFLKLQSAEGIQVLKIVKL